MKYERGKIYEIRVRINTLDGDIFILEHMPGQRDGYTRTEQDILTYVYVNKIPICPVYGNIVTDREVPENIMDLGLLDNRPVFSTTGLNRTGCMFCGFGCHLEKKGEGRFLKLKETHPKIYDYIMKPESEGGLGYKWKIDWINEHGFHIEY